MPASQLVMTVMGGETVFSSLISFFGPYAIDIDGRILHGGFLLLGFVRTFAITLSLQVTRRSPSHHCRPTSGACRFRFIGGCLSRRSRLSAKIVRRLTRGH